MTTRPLILLAVAALFLSGCRHRQRPTQTVALPPLTQVPVEPLPPSGAKVPAVTAGPAPEASITPPRKVRKPRRKPAPALPAPSAPAQVASTGAPPAAAADVVGALSTGGDSSPSTRDKAVNLLATQQKRLRELPPAAAEMHTEVERVRYFCAQATDALKAGDADGALTLATKAKVLLDELWK